MVAYEDELANGGLPAVHHGEQAQQVGFENLRGLVNDGEREVHQDEEAVLPRERRSRPCHDARRSEELPPRLGRLPLQPLLKQIGAIGQLAAFRTAYAQEVEPHLHEFRADFIYRAVGI